MIKAIIYRPSIRECELCHRKLRLSRKECIFLYGRLMCYHFQERIRGYWKEVMVNQTVKLDGLSKEDFVKLYNMM